jgi:hypothetical protein
VPGIERILWSSLGTSVWSGQTGRLFAVWPAPVNHDVCFKAAGFDDFADSDEAWHMQFQSALDRAVASLSSHGAALVTRGEAAALGFIDRLLRKKATAARAAKRLGLAAYDDQFGTCCVQFGTPVRAIACTTNGHPIVWIWLGDSVTDSWSATLHAFGQDRPVAEANLNWEHLGPPAMFTHTQTP